MAEKGSQKENFGKETRPPIAVVMGHIDHGKTKILDWYRKTKVAEKESGGITQHIGAYQIEHRGKKITFIDTPGHEAFSKMRSRGARVADIAVLVIAADEGVKPQTQEAIQTIKENKLPFLVALNKIDKPEANPERVKQQLAENEVLVESYGGKTPSVEISAKTGQNMDELLEVLLLVAEMENLKADPQKNARGLVIEAHLDARRGISATLLIQDGSLKIGDIIVIGRNAEHIKILEDFLGRAIGAAGPSDPILVAGLSETPAVGDSFQKFPNRAEAEKFIKNLPPEETILKSSASAPSEESEEKTAFNIILKADVLGSREALEESLEKFNSPKLRLNIIRSEIGDINESDLKLASATKLVTVVGFKVKMEPSVKELAQKQNIRILTGDVIYRLLDEVKKEVEERIPPEIKKIELGRAKVLKIFRKDGNKQIIGGRVESGKIKNGARVEIKREGQVAGGGTILELQKNKIKVEEAQTGAEFGILLNSPVAIREGDVLEIFEEEIVKPAL